MPGIAPGSRGVPAAKNRVIVADCSEIIGSHNDAWGGNAALAALLLRVMR